MRLNHGISFALVIAASLSATLALSSCASRAAPRSAGTKDAEGSAASTAGNSCSTRYPILLVHGVAFRDDQGIAYWGSIPERLRANGALVYLAGNESLASIEDNAVILARRIIEILAETGAAKVNIVAHSKGGLDSRYLISRLGFGDRVASLSTFNTPHRGSSVADYLGDEHPIAFSSLGNLADFMAKELFGEKAADARLVAFELTTKACAAFNEANPDDPAVFYQSFASRIDAGYPVTAFALVYRYIYPLEGDNDGMVSVASARWGAFKGIVGSERGVSLSHADIVDAPIISADKGRFDVPGFYVQVVADLRRAGF